MSPNTLLLGLGNDILTDDAIGLRVAETCRKINTLSEKVAIAASPEMGLSLLDHIIGFDNLVIVDAVETGKYPPGFVHELEGADLAAFPAISPHFLGVGEVLALGQKLGMHVPRRVKIFAVEVQDAVTVSTGMTPALEAALSRIVEQVRLGLASVVAGH